MATNYRVSDKEEVHEDEKVLKISGEDENKCQNIHILNCNEEQQPKMLPIEGRGPYRQCTQESNMNKAVWDSLEEIQRVDTTKIDCKKCKEQERDIVFKDCCHFVSCEKCANGITACFICGKVITEKIKIYM